MCSAPFYASDSVNKNKLIVIFIHGDAILMKAVSLDLCFAISYRIAWNIVTWPALLLHVIVWPVFVLC